MANPILNANDGSTLINADGKWVGPGKAASNTLLSDLSSGLVVALGVDTYETHDPADTSTPVQDAASDLHGSGVNGGRIFLPPGATTDSGPLRNLQNKSITGVSAGRGVSNSEGGTDPDDDHGSTLVIDGGGDGIIVDDYDDGNTCYLANFTLRADDQTDGRSAIRFTDEDSDSSTANPRQFQMHNMRFTNWKNTNTDRGIISMEDNHAWSSHWSSLVFQDVQGHAISGSTSDMGNFISIGNLLYMPADDSDATTPKQSAIALPTGKAAATQIEIGYLNCGNYARRAIDMNNLSANGYIGVGGLNFEGDNLSSVSGPAIRAGGKGNFWIRHAKVVSIDVDSIIELGTNNRDNKIGYVETAGGVTVSNSKIYVTSDKAGPSYYFGSTSDVGNDGSTSDVRCLATAGTSA